MRVKNLPSDPQKFHELNTKGWINNLFLSVLTPQEWELILGKPSETESSENIHNNLKKIRNKLYQISPFGNLFEVETQFAITSGIRSLDLLCDGSCGYQSGRITVLYGSFRTGKSQLCHQSIIQAFLLPHSPTTPYTAVFIDTEGTFRPERIMQMAAFHHLSADDVLKKTYIIRVNSITEMKLALLKIQELLQNCIRRGNPIPLLVIDSLTHYYRVEFGKDSQKSTKILAEFQHILSSLSSWAHDYNLVVLCTSQVTASMSDSHFFNVIPLFSTLLNFYCKQWILLSVDPNITETTPTMGRRFAHLINSQTKKETIITYSITDSGVEEDISQKH